MKTFTIHNFKPIGKAVLHRIIGLRDNYTLERRELPENCNNCPFFYEMQTYKLFPESPEYNNASEKCNTCDSHSAYHLWEVKTSPDYTEYINEKNRYGGGKSLKYTAIMLFITYHMICPDQNGILENISISELAEALGCSKKTIHYNNRVLDKNGYIYLSKGAYPGTINICLKEYPAYFQPAKKGGRGFYTLSKELYASLLGLKLTNQLRIILKTLLDNDSAISLFPGEITASYQDMRLYLPKYCKRNVIQKALDSINTAICTIKTSLHNVSFKIHPDFDGKRIKQLLCQTNLSSIKTTINTSAASIKKAIASKQLPKFEDKFFVSVQNNYKNISYKPLSISEQQFKDLADISLDYSLDMVLAAVATIYFSVICNKQTIRNLGGLVRETIKSNIEKLSSFPNAIA